MDKEKVQQRLDLLKSEREKLFQNLLAYDGAIQDCQWWLDNIDKPVNSEGLTVVDGGQQHGKQ